MATVDVLVDGYARGAAPGDPEGASRVGSTVALVRSGDLVCVVDPGMQPSVDSILDPLAAHGLTPEDVTDVVLSHHHPDHTVHAGAFRHARVHDHWAWYAGDVWVSRPAEGVRLADDIVLWETPGHTPQDVSTVVTTDEGVVVLTHLWWYEGIEGDPRGTDLAALHDNRRRVLEVASVVVPGHGPAFAVTEDTPA